MKCYKLLVCFSVIALFSSFPVSFLSADPKRGNRIQKSGSTGRKQANILRVAARMAPPQQNRQDVNSQRPQNSIMTGRQNAPTQEPATVIQEAVVPPQHELLTPLTRTRDKGDRRRKAPAQRHRHAGIPLYTTDESSTETEVTNTLLALPGAEDNTDTIDSSNPSAKAVSGEAISAPQKQGANQASQEEDKERSVANTQQEQKSPDTAKKWQH